MIASPNLTNHYSGIALNQNALSNELYPWRNSNANWVYQTFTLPSDYQRGIDAAELRIPDLSGIQVLVVIDPGMASAAALDYVLEYYTGSKTGWVQLANGTVIGTHADGDVWFDIIFPDPVAISSKILGSLFRFGIQGRTATGALYVPVGGSDGVYTIGNQVYLATLADGIPYPITVNNQPAFLLSSNGQVTYSLQQGIDSLRCVMPTPLIQTSVGQGQLYRSDGITPLLGLPTSLNFRILALTADNGTNFLNNEYRSCVVTASAQDVDTTGTPISSNTLGHWMSPPQPSRFAVLNLYFDMRPAPLVPNFGLINYAGNPSFEYDEVGTAPQWWLTYSSGGTVLDQTVHDTQATGGNWSPWVYDGERALHMKYSFSASSQRQGILSDYQQVAASTNSQPTPFTVSVAYDLITASSSRLEFAVLFYDKNQTALPNPVIFNVSAIGSGVLSGSGVLPANAVYIRQRIYGRSTGAGSFEAYIDAAQLTFTSVPEAYFDGDKTNCQWVGQRGQSASAQLTTAATTGNSVVIDSALVDPITPNLAFNVYYSVDDAYTSADMSESDWEQKLWIRVPEVFICTQRQQYVFPTPVIAKYMKVEFTNLQAQPYQPGPLAKPVQYKKFPIWVADYFIAQLTLPSFVASSVEVQYDALSFAYDYYLGDLNQEPATPTAPPQSAISQLTSYFNPVISTTGLDAATLAQINLAMKTFQVPLGTYVDTRSALGSFVSSLLGTPDPPVSIAEGGTLTPIDYSSVSSLRREPMVFEQSLPVMYFFVTCRHAYRELAASFDYDRAYFAGINEISFLRNDYQVATDTPLYIESGGDSTNVTFNDWVLDTDQIWYVY